jgi:hypothetical protein
MDSLDLDTELRLGRISWRDQEQRVKSNEIMNKEDYE